MRKVHRRSAALAIARAPALLVLARIRTSAIKRVRLRADIKDDDNVEKRALRSTDTGSIEGRGSCRDIESDAEKVNRCRRGIARWTATRNCVSSSPYDDVTSGGAQSTL
ncbi:hypothetical protein C8J57DRAFT_1333570, partial [Mycena rebaudengoi]